MNSIVNYSEARDEAERLSRMLKRDVDVKPEMCCDFDKSCGSCGGQGYVYALVYSSCGHVVPDGDDEECEAGDCVHKSYLADVDREERLEVAR